MKNQMRAYRDAYAAQEYDKADKLLKASVLKKDKKSELLWHLEEGTVSLALGKEDKAITQFQTAIDLIDQLYTKKISAKAEMFLVNDASDVFYGSSYERSYAYYFLSKAYYSRYQKTANKLDLQGARATILAWDSYFSQLQRSAAPKTIYQTDLMLKVFGAEVHEVSEIRNDKQIALQLYKDAIGILDTMGGSFSVFNSKSQNFIEEYEASLSADKKPSAKTYVTTSAQTHFKNFLHYKVLSLTKEIRSSDYAGLIKSLKPAPEVLKKLDQPKANIVVVLEEGLIPQKVGKPFNFGLKGAIDSVDSPGAKSFIAGAGSAMVTAFAMETLHMSPDKFDNSGSFVFAQTATQLAVTEAAIAFELPMIEDSPKLKDLDLVIMDEKGKILHREPMAVVSENGDIAKIVLEEDVVSRYVRTGTRVAVKHILAIVAAMQVHNNLKKNGDFIAKAAAMATYIGASKGIAASEKADVRHWTTLPQAFRMMEINLSPGKYQVAIGQVTGEPKILGNIQVADSSKTIHTFKLINP